MQVATFLIMLALDTEDDSEGDVKIINFFNGVKHKTFTGKDLRVKAWDYLNTFKKREMVWACNAEYDIINLFGSEWIGRLITLLYVSSGLMRGSFKEAPVTFYDTLRHWPMSVEQMGKFLGLPKLKQDFLSVKYCRRDTEIVWRFVNQMLSRYEALGLSLRSTLPAMALQLFKKFYGDDFIQLPPDVLEFLRNGYYGGRVEVFRTGKIEGDIHHYDVNSLFPSVMRNLPFPVLSSWRHTIKPDFSREGMFEGWVKILETNITCLPVREDDEIVFPYGGVYGTWPYVEIRQLLEDGGQVLHCKKAIEFWDTERPFPEYVDFCYQKRLESTTDLDRVFWKLMLNSLYGKFAQSRGLTTIYFDKQQKRVAEKTIDSQSKVSNVIWSAYVTAYGRVKLLSYLRECSEVYYTDTDSIFTPDVLSVSNELGSLKEEGRYKKAEFLGNKLYVVDGLAKAKGVPRGSAMDFIRTGRAIYRRPARFRESLRTFARANVWYSVEKKLEKRYTKRKSLDNGMTRAWDYSEYRREMKK